MLLISLVLVGVLIWNITNIVSFRELGYLYLEGGITILLLLISAVMTFVYCKENKQARKGNLIVLGIMLISVLIMLNYISQVEFIETLKFYLHLSIFASIVVLAGMIGNVAKIERKEGEGFAIHLHSKDSPIPPKFIVPVWLVVFFLMGGLVKISGQVLVQYPDFGILSEFGKPATSGFGVADWENLAFLVAPFAIAYALAKLIKLQNFPSFLIGLIVGTATFSVYHNFVYSSNIFAMLLVMLFGIMTLTSYYFTKSIVIMSAMHVGNNFWGALFNYNIIAFSAFGGTVTLSSIMFGVGIILIAGISIFIIVKKGKRK